MVWRVEKREKEGREERHAQAVSDSLIGSVCVGCRRGTVVSREGYGQIFLRFTAKGLGRGVGFGGGCGGCPTKEGWGFNEQRERERERARESDEERRGAGGESFPDV